MQAVRIENARKRPLGAPLDWSEEKHGRCGGLFVRDELIGGVPFMRSAWEPSHDDLLCLLAGSKLILGIQGREKHPVVNMGVGQVPEDFEPFTISRRITKPSGHDVVRVDFYWPAGGCFAECLLDGRTYAEALAEAADRAVEWARENKLCPPEWGKR